MTTSFVDIDAKERASVFSHGIQIRLMFTSHTIFNTILHFFNRDDTIIINKNHFQRMPKIFCYTICNHKKKKLQFKLFYEK